MLSKTAKLAVAPLVFAAGCAATGDRLPATETATSQYRAAAPDAAQPAPPPVAPPAASETAAEAPRVRPAYGKTETLPIDLPTVIRLVDENSPAIGFARARTQEAQARLDRAAVQWLPSLSVGGIYNRFDGQTQNQRGEVFGVSRANGFGGAGAALTLDTADAIYRPLIERRATNAEAFRAQAATANGELEAVTAYLDLVQVHGLLAVNAETTAKAEAMLKAATDAREKKLDRTAGDVNRAQTELLFRRTERIDLEGRAGGAAARLAKLLLLAPSVRLVPADTAVAPVTLIDANATLDELVGIAIANRPELAADRELVAAAWTRVRREERGPLFPKITAANQTGAYGGGVNDDLQNFDARNALSLQLYWEVKNLGFGNRADADERRALLDQSRFQQVETRARVAAEVVELAQTAAARYETLDLSERAVKEATELYRISKEGTTNVLDAKNLFDALRPLQAIQALNQARTNYLTAVMDFNRAQYRLFTALGNAPRCAR